MSTYQEIKNSLVDLYTSDQRPWLVGFSGGKDSTMLASLLFEAVLKVDEFSESHRAFGLPDDLLNILKDDLDSESNTTAMLR
jgi:DNA sulfur modification protein DndC